MEDQLGALGLVLNCIVLWNTVYINAALEQLRAAGYPVLDEDVVRLHPFMRRHLGVQGDYSFRLPPEATLVSVPPYHIAGMAAILTAVYGGRRLVQLPSFEPDEWVRLARDRARHPRHGRARRCWPGSST